MNDRPPVPPAAPSDLHRYGIPADEWHVCSKIFTEGRRMRALAAELRGIVPQDGSPAGRHALERYVQALDTASALGDITADALVTRRES